MLFYLQVKSDNDAFSNGEGVAERGETFQELYRCPDTPDMFNANPVKEAHRARI
jgi:hypothetical protein